MTSFYHPSTSGTHIVWNHCLQTFVNLSPLMKPSVKPPVTFQWHRLSTCRAHVSCRWTYWVMERRLNKQQHTLAVISLSQPNILQNAGIPIYNTHPKGNYLTTVWKLLGECISLLHKKTYFILRTIEWLEMPSLHWAEINLFVICPW